MTGSCSTSASDNGLVQKLNEILCFFGVSLYKDQCHEAQPESGAVHAASPILFCTEQKMTSLLNASEVCEINTLCYLMLHQGPAALRCQQVYQEMYRVQCIHF